LERNIWGTKEQRHFQIAAEKKQKLGKGNRHRNRERERERED
jgi:hypothetical protein